MERKIGFCKMGAFKDEVWEDELGIPKMKFGLPGLHWDARCGKWSMGCLRAGGGLERARKGGSGPVLGLRWLPLPRRYSMLHLTTHTFL